MIPRYVPYVVGAAILAISHIWVYRKGVEAESARNDAVIASQVVKVAEIEAAQAKQIQELNRAHAETRDELSGRLAVALKRVPLRACPRVPQPSTPADIATGHPGGGSVAARDRPLEELRDADLRDAAIAEGLRRAALQAREAWPR